MKINKITTIICTLASLLFGGVLFIPQIPDNLFSVISNIFTGFVVSIIISLIGYFYEKHKIIEKTYNNLKSIYINMGVLTKITGNTLKRVHEASYLKDLKFEKISSIAGLNIEFIEGMDLGLFDAFFKSGDFSKIYEKLSEFQKKLYNLKNISGELEMVSLEHSIAFMTAQTNQNIGMQTSQNNLAALDSMKNAINIRTAKLHEYEASLRLEIDSLAEQFSKAARRKESWKDIKQSLLMQVEDLTKSD